MTNIACYREVYIHVSSLSYVRIRRDSTHTSIKKQPITTLTHLTTVGIREEHSIIFDHITKLIIDIIREPLSYFWVEQTEKTNASKPRVK